MSTTTGERDCRFLEILGGGETGEIVTRVLSANSKNCEYIKSSSIRCVVAPVTYDLFPVYLRVSTWKRLGNENQRDNCPNGLEISLSLGWTGDYRHTFRATSCTASVAYQSLEGMRQNKELKIPNTTEFLAVKSPESQSFGTWIRDIPEYLNESTEISATLQMERVDEIESKRIKCKNPVIQYERDGISLKKYLNSTKFSDFEVSVGGRSFPCHRVILAAQSPVFAQMFEHPTKENLEGRIEIEDMEAETMAEVLCFLYTGTSDGLERNDMETVVTLHQVADRYLIEQLGVRCRAVKALTAEGVTEDNVTDLWEEAEFYKLEEVKNAVKDFCWKNRNLVILDKSESLKNLIRKCFPHFRCPPSTDCSFCKELTPHPQH